MRKGQVWIETVVYTLVGLTLIGIVLAFVTPKVNEYRDKAVIEQTITAFNVIDSTVNELLVAPGNARVVELRIKKGDFRVDSDNDKIIFLLEDSKVLFSEPGEQTSIGRVNIITRENQNSVSVELFMNYNLDLQGNIKLTPSTTPYMLRFENLGDVNGRNAISVSELSGA